MGVNAFLFLCKLAWAARYRIPLIISVAFMALDVRMALDIDIHMRNAGQADDYINDGSSDSETEVSGDTWITIEEEEIS